MIDGYQEVHKKHHKIENFFGKVLVVQKKSRTFAPANQENLLISKQKKEFFERFT